MGCKVNQYDTQIMKELLLSSGYQIVGEEMQPDVFIVNSCSVTGKSDSKTRQLLSKLRKKLPHSILILTGCMPQAFPAETALLDTADIILSNASNDEIVSLIDEFLRTKTKIIQIKSHEKEKINNKITNFDDRTKAFLKIEDGCNRFCSYCIIPYARGRVRSKPLSEIFTEINELSLKGYKEVVLIGINLSAYGTDMGYTLADAVETACSVDGIRRVRLGSIEPDQLNDTIIERMAAENKLCPQFHLSLQSGCDKTLRDMNRHYDTAFYDTLVQKLREKFKDASITTDIMVGFPGETEEDFNESLGFVKKVGFARAHIFPYSKRNGTKAADFKNQVQDSVKNRRSKEMIELTNRSKTDFLKNQLHKTYPVLIENNKKPGQFEGYTPNYTHVKIQSDTNLSGSIVNVFVTAVDGDSLTGEKKDG